MPPPRSGPPVRDEHLRLLEVFGKSKPYLEHKDDAEVVSQLWRATCQAAKLPDVPFQVVREQWRSFVAGVNPHSHLALSSDPAPEITTVAVLYGRQVRASHALSTRTLFRAVLALQAKLYRSEADFLLDVRTECLAAWKKRTS